MGSARHALSPPPLPGCSLSLEILSTPPPPAMLWLWQPLWKLQVLNEFPPQRKLRGRHVPPATSELPTFLLPLQKKDQTLFHNGRRRGWGEEDRRGRKEKKERIREPHLILIRQSLCLNYTFFSPTLRKPIHKGKQVTCYLFTSPEFSLIDSKRI